MKRFLSMFIVFAISLCLCCPALAADVVADSENTGRISRAALDEIRGDTPALTNAQYNTVVELINERAAIEQANNLASLNQASTRQSVSQGQARINAIDAELNTLGVIELSVEDLYAMTDSEYRPGAPSVPGDTNYVHFYGMTTYVGDYEVWSIVASSTGYDQSSLLSVPFYTDGTAVIYDQDAYVQADFSKYIDMASSIASSTFAEKAFEKLPVLNYISTAWDVATFLNPTSTQKITVDYDANQVFIFSYVAESSVGYFDFMLTAERKQGTCVLISRQFTGSSSHVENLAAGEFEVFSNHYADYAYAVDLYRNGMSRAAYYAGNIQFKLDNSVVATISMPTYSELWSIPGI